MHTYVEGLKPEHVSVIALTKIPDVCVFQFHDISRSAEPLKVTVFARQIASGPLVSPAGGNTQVVFKSR